MWIGVAVKQALFIPGQVDARERERRRESLQNLVVDLDETCQIQPPQAGELARFQTTRKTDTARAARRKAQQIAEYINSGRRAKEEEGKQEGKGREGKAGGRGW